MLIVRHDLAAHRARTRNSGRHHRGQGGRKGGVRDSDGKRRIVGGKKSKLGTPQGGVASPLLANIYMNRFLKNWRLSGRDEAFRAHVVSYADDFVILSRGCAAEALAWTKAVMPKLGLTLNESKTSLKDARRERFDFLGYCVLQRHIERRSA
jgi:RNA-directed DNA polymerase